MSDIDMTRVDKAQEFEFIIGVADQLDSANGRFFSKLAHRDKGGDPNTIDKGDLKAALELDDRKREFSRGFLTDRERKSAIYMLNHWDDEKLKVLRDDLVSYDSKGQEFSHQGFADITRRSVDRAVSFFAQPIAHVVAEGLPPAAKSKAPDLRDPYQRNAQLCEQQQRDLYLRELQNQRRQREEQQPPLESSAKGKTTDCPEKKNNGKTVSEAATVQKMEKVADQRPSEAEILKNTQAYLSGTSEPKGKDEFKPHITESDALREEMRRRQIFAMTPMPDRVEPHHQAGPLTEEHHHSPVEHYEPSYTLRDGVHDTLGIVNSLSRAAMPFLMWDVAKEHAQNGSGYYRRANHFGDPYGPGYYRPSSPWLYNRGYNSYGPGFHPGYRNFGNQFNFGPQFRGNFYPQDSDSSYSHAGPDGLTFFQNRQRVPGYSAPHQHSAPPRGYYDGYDNGYYSRNGLHDTLDAISGLSQAALPWLQWDLAKQHARNQRQFYENRGRRW